MSKKQAKVSLMYLLLMIIFSLIAYICLKVFSAITVLIASIGIVSALISAILFCWQIYFSFKR